MDKVAHIIEKLNRDQLVVFYVKDSTLRGLFHQELNSLSWNNPQYSHTSMNLQGIGESEMVGVQDFNSWLWTANFVHTYFHKLPHGNCKTMRKNAIIVGPYLCDYRRTKRKTDFWHTNENIINLIQGNKLTYILLRAPHKKMKKKLLRIFFEIQIIFRSILYQLKISFPDHIYDLIFHYI